MVQYIVAGSFVWVLMSLIVVMRIKFLLFFVEERNTHLIIALILSVDNV